MFWHTNHKTSPSRPARRQRLEVEALEDRLALSWAGVPPALVTPPSGAAAVTLNSQAAAQGTAAITQNEVDYFTFVAPTTGSYRLNALTPSSNLDPVLGLFNSSGQRLAYNDDISSSNTDSQLNANLTAGQRYYFGVTNYTNTPGGGYSWSVAGPAPAATDDAFENNDTRTTAFNLGTLSARRTINGLVMNDAADWFRFTMSGAGTSANAVAIQFQHSQGDLDLKLYNSAGTLLRTADGTGNSETVSLSGLAAGTYSIQVYGYQGVKNPNYTLDITPGAGTTVDGRKFLYLNFDGATIGRSDLVRWAGSDWSGTVNQFDAEGDGIRVSRFLSARGDREQIISQIVSYVQQDLSQFGITVQRVTGLAVENQGATTIFLGPSTLSGGLFHVADDIDVGNNNRTDIAFVGDEDWGSTARTALALADVVLHEAGHTYGLYHVNSGTALESMGLRYSNANQEYWVNNSAFLNQTFALREFSGTQNSYQVMAATFGLAPGAPFPQVPTTLVNHGNHAVHGLPYQGQPADEDHDHDHAGHDLALVLTGMGSGRVDRTAAARTLARAFSHWRQDEPASHADSGPARQVHTGRLHEVFSSWSSLDQDPWELAR